ncbi:ribosome maturation factor RimP [Natranaerovirga pectinivora]|uniref:Ribosome maturation factor RimP n=1 Tax=Natranaerovirga pectinivora TaxID=682400 RepID=A0A4R3MMI1_9FIRM|nr:ribosome maturation factor RimP [Natranaerovirga pectinivora]TCT15055.1 ribosome maturation factor RimP [Natranaerovirga pectinivora]
MSVKDNIEEKTTGLLEPIIEANNFELVDVEYVKEGSNWYLRAFIDKEGGITIDDCELVSRALEAKLDEKEFIPVQYILEVSSPGLDRPLKKEKDFQRSIDKLIELKLYKAVDKQKEFIGILREYDKDTIKVELDNNELVEFNRSDIALIRLAIVF